jgi:hypothetical protein
LDVSLILIYQGLEEENLDQKSPGPPGWRLMQRANSSLIIKKQEMLKTKAPTPIFPPGKFLVHSRSGNFEESKDVFIRPLIPQPCRP